MNSRKLLLVALGSATSAEAQKMKNMPRVGALAARGTLVTDVDSVFVSSAAPCAASILTGVHPKDHRVLDDSLPVQSAAAPGAPQSSRLRDYRYIKAPTLIGQARKAGHSVCSVMWPVTGGAEIDFHIPDIYPSPRPLAAMLRAGGGRFAFWTYMRRWRLAAGLKQPGLDDFALQAALDCLRRNRPGLTLLRFDDLGRQKHDHGPAASETRDALERCDKRVGLLVDALWDAGTLDETDIILCGDHGCLPVTQTVDLTRYLGDLAGQAVFHQSGGVACLRLRRQDDIELQKRAAHVIKDILEDPSSGAYRVLTPEEMAVSGLDTRFDIGLEAATGCAFRAGDPSARRSLSPKGARGYTLEHNDYKTFYLAVGPHIPQGRTFSGGSILDICPLAARLLALPPWGMDGEIHIPLVEE